MSCPPLLFSAENCVQSANAAAAEALNDILSPIKNNKNLKVG